MHLKTVAKYIRRSPYQSVAAILIMILTFFTISVFAFMSVFSVKLINYFESRPQLTVFFKDNTRQSDIDSLKSQIENTGKASSIKFISKEDAFKIYKDQNKNDPLLLDLVTPDILPASFEISAVKAEYLSDLASTVKGQPQVEEVVFQKDIVDTLISWTNAFRAIGIALIAVLSTVSVFIILTIIGIKITIRKEEIEIMKLIGATNWFIRAPFILEGMFYGFVGALFGWSFSYLILLYSSSRLELFMKGIPVFPIDSSIIIGIFGVEVLGAVFLGAFASFLAVLRYLK
ncbi:ABC transporter permease [Patescibacteria group bacterium]|nr:ABC transporter permease [Patescibacteria group bacterium]